MTTKNDTPRIIAPARSEQFERWQRGERVLVEELLPRHPDLAANDEAVLELICSELLLREEAGESPTSEEYAARFPAMAEAVSRQVVAHWLMRVLAIPEDADVTVDGALRVAAPALDPLRTLAPDARSVVGPTDESSVVPTKPAPAAPTSFPTVPGYDVLSELGRGGMGVVYLAVDRDLKRTVALKMIREHSAADGAFLKRFRAEATAVARLQHPSIVQIHDYGEHDGRPYFSLEYVAGGGLDRLMRSEPQPVAESVALVAALARAVAFAHRQGIIHRDLKPANILLARRDETSGSQLGNRSREPVVTLAEAVPKITDFGLAKSLESDQELTRSEAIVGTPAYMSPEQAWGRSRDVGPATDVHALGLILYELLTGRNPFRDPSFARSLDKIRFDEPAAPSTLRHDAPAALDDVCRRCLRKEPSERYATADELADDLERVLRGEQVRVDGGTTRVRSRVISIFGVAVAVSIALLVAAGIGGWNAFRSASSRGGLSGTNASGSTASGGAILNASTSDHSTSQAAGVGTAPRAVGERFALLSGVRSYRLPGLALDLSYTEADVDELSRALLKTGFDRKNIRLLTQWAEADNPALAPTGRNIREQLRAMLANCIPDDTFLVVLTGMGGARGKTGMYCYLPADADPDRPETLIPLSDLYDLLRECPARRKLVLVDTCQTVDGGDHDWPPVPEPPPGVAVLFACSPGEASYESDTARHGVFTHHVLRGLEGRADHDGDGTLTLAELSDFTRGGVHDFLKNEAAGRTQTPLLVTSLPGETPILPLRREPR